MARRKGIPKTGGRQKGTPNKLSKSAREAIEIAANDLGGADRLTTWAKESAENERAFWVTIYPKLLPLQVNASGSLTGGSVTFNIQPVRALTDAQLEAIAASTLEEQTT